MSTPRLFSLPLAGDDTLTVLHATPKVARPFPRRKSIMYGFICLLWLSFGIFGRDPWKPEETLLVAAVADLLQQQTTNPTLFGLHERPPLYIALATATATLTAGHLPLHEGARLANILLLIGGFSCLWLAAARIYGVRTAWLALMLLVGCFGFMVRAHVLNFGIPAFFGMALALLGAAVLADEKHRVSQVFWSGCIIGTSAAFLLLAHGMAAAAVALTALTLAKKQQSAVYAVSAAFFLPMLLWGLRQEMVLFAVPDNRFSSASGFAAAVGDMGRVAAWSLLPLLPLAAYGLWYTRRQPLQRLLRFCLLAVFCGFIVFLIGGKNEEDYYLLLPPLALAAAHLLLKTPDGTASAMDFFAVLIIGLCGVSGLWLLWMTFAWQLAPLMAPVQAALPGFTLPPVHAGKVTAAALLTAAWVVLLFNFGRSNERAVVNWSCGITLVWVVFNLLLIGYVDSGKSYRQPAGKVLAATGTDCVSPPPDKHWHAQLRYFGVVMGDDSCPYYLSAAAGEHAVLHVARSTREAGYYLYRRF